MPAIDRFRLFAVIEAPHNNGMHLTALRAAGDADAVELNRFAVE